jgi:hypothetical protein
MSSGSRFFIFFKDSARSIALTTETVWTESGSAVPLGGTWLLESDLTTKVVLQK